MITSTSIILTSRSSSRHYALCMALLFITFSSFSYCQQQGGLSQQSKITLLLDGKTDPSSGSPTYQNDLQTAFSNVKEGATISLTRGTIQQATALTLDAPNVHFRGATSDPADTVIAFSSSDDWIKVTSTGITFEGLTFTGINRPMDVSQVDITLKNCHFKTSSGSQIFKKIDTPTMTAARNLVVQSSTFESDDFSAFTTANSAFVQQHGGLIQLALHKSRVEISTSHFIGGKANEGGCLHINNMGDTKTTVSIDHSDFTNCVAQQDGGAAYVHIANIHAESRVAFSETIIKQCKALRNGGGIHLANIPLIPKATWPAWARPAPTVDWRITSFHLTDITFEDNLASNGGGMFMSGTSMSRLQTDADKYITFRRNHAVKNGGGLHIQSPRFFKQHIGDCDMTFDSNTAGEESTLTALQTLTTAVTLEQQNGDEEGGAIFVGEASTAGTHLVFKKNPKAPNFINNKARRGGAIASHSHIWLNDVWSQGNSARGDGGSLLMFRHTTVSQSKFFNDRAGGDGGAIAAGGGGSSERGGSVWLRGITIKDAYAGGVGGAISARGGIATLELSPGYIINCFSTGQASAIHFFPENYSSRFIMNGGTLIYGNHASSPAVVVKSSSRDINVWTTEVEYRNNNGGHLLFDTSDRHQTRSAEPIKLVSISDYFDDSALQNDKASLTIRSPVIKEFTNTFFQGMCNDRIRTRARQTIVEQCSSDITPASYPGGYWGGNGCVINGEACAPPTYRDSNCGESRVCSRVQARVRHYSNYLEELVPGLVSPSLITMRTTETTTPAAPATTEEVTQPPSQPTAAPEA